jgi:Tfp pilus assembly protein PilE
LADPQPRRGIAAKLALPAVLAVIILGMVSPLAANAYKKRQLAEHEVAIVALIKEFRQAQDKYKAAHDGQSASKFSDLQLSVPLADLDAPSPGSNDGYRFRMVSGGTQDKSFELMVVPVKYGITGWHTFFLSSGDIYYADLGVKTERIIQGLIAVPANAVRLEN